MNRKQLTAMWLGIAVVAFVILFPFSRYTGTWQPRSIFAGGPPMEPLARDIQNGELLLVTLVTVGAILTLKDRRP